MPDLKALKINNAAWLPTIAEHVEQFCKLIHVDGIQPGNLQTYFAQVAQGWYGENGNEFWMVFEDEKPIAFGAWQVLGLPHIAKVYWFALYSWGGKNNVAAELLGNEFIRFGEKHNARWWSFDPVNKAAVRLLEARMKKKGFKGTESGFTNVVYRKE